ncbi:MAG: TraR/DksA family transcriptional regulator [Smithella sp.]
MNSYKSLCVRNSLIGKMQELLASADNTIRKLKINDDKFADPCDRAVEEASKDIELNCRSKEWNLLLDIKETILRIDHGLYGICDHCGRPISQKRLRAAPMSKLCVECQEKIETKQKTNRRYSNTTRISYHNA